MDREAVLRQMGVLDDNTIDMLRMFLTMTRPMIEKLRDAFTRNDKARLKEIAHSLKGAARSACCMALGDAAAVIQDYVQNITPVTEAHILAVESEFQRAEADIETMKAVSNMNI